MFSANVAPFHPIPNSSGPSFNSSAMGTTSANYALESTAINRIWQGPIDRTVRLFGEGTGGYYANFGSSVVAAASTNSVLCIANQPVLFSVTPTQTYVALVSSTTVTVNVTLGVGG